MGVAAPIRARTVELVYESRVVDEVQVTFLAPLVSPK